MLVFNPGDKHTQSLCIDEANPPVIRDNVYNIAVRRSLPTDRIDMVLCEQNYSDLILECLTKKQFEDEYEEQCSGTHSLVVVYGTKKFFVHFKRPAYEKLHGFFGYAAGDRWKTHYFKFCVPRLMERLLNRP